MCSYSNQFIFIANLVFAEKTKYVYQIATHATGNALNETCDHEAYRRVEIQRNKSEQRAESAHFIHEHDGVSTTEEAQRALGTRGAHCAAEHEERIYRDPEQVSE